MNKERVIATGTRGKYVLKAGGYVWNDATGTEYGSCVMGDLDYFLRLVEKDSSYRKLTEEGLEVYKAWNDCKKCIKCSYCKDMTCLYKR